MEDLHRETLETEFRARFESSCDKLWQHYMHKQPTPIVLIDHQPSKDEEKSLFLADGTLNHYIVLGLNALCTTAQVYQSFEQTAAQYYAIENPTPEQTTQFERALETYNILRNPLARGGFDDHRRRLNPGAQYRLDHYDGTAPAIWQRKYPQHRSHLRYC